MDNDDKPEDASGLPAVVDTSVVPSTPRAFTVITGDGPSPAAHLVRHPDGFVCLLIDSPEPSRTHLRLVDSSYNTESVASEVTVTDVTVTDESGGDIRF